jgi:hypothetical protein
VIYGALDLAKQSGVCWGEPNGRPSFETWHLGGQALERGQRGAALMTKLVSWIAYAKPDLVFIEAPISAVAGVARGTSIDTSIALQGFILIAETVCYTRKIPTKLIERQDALYHFTGRARYKVKGQAKKACMARCCQLRWQPANEDEADAGAMWHYGCAKEDPRAFALAGVNEAVKISRSTRR